MSAEGGARPPRAVRPPARPLVFLITATGVMTNPLVAPAVPDVLADFGRPDGQAGLLVGASTLLGIVLAPVIGILADRYGRRPVTALCLGVFGVAGALSALAPTFEILLLLRLVQGAGTAGLLNLAVAIIGDHWHGVERSKILGQNAAVLTSLISVLPLIGGALTALGGWRLTFAPYVLGVVAAVVLYRGLPDIPGDRSVRARAQLSGALTLVRSPPVAASIGLGAMAFFLVFGLYVTLLPLHLVDRFGLGPLGRGLLFSLPALPSTFASLAIGPMRRRVARRWLVVIGFMIMGVSFAVLGATSQLWVAALALAVFGAGQGMVPAVLQDVVAGAAPTSSRGTVVALWVSGARVGQTIGPVMAGVGVATIGTGATYEVGALVAFGAVAVQIAAQGALQARTRPSESLESPESSERVEPVDLA